MAQRVRLSEVRKRRGRNILLLLVSIYFASALVQTGAVARWLDTAAGNEILTSFFAGMLFTSLFTIAPAAVTLVELLREAPFFLVAIAGASGAVMGDLLLFLFVRDAVSYDIQYLLKGSVRRKIQAHFRHPWLQWIVPLVGGLLIASPLPDEIGLAMLGLSRLSLAVLIPVTFVTNFIGIALIWLGMQAL